MMGGTVHFKSFHIESHLWKTSAFEVVELFRQTARARGLEETTCQDADVLVAIGGDGTFLRTAQMAFTFKKPFWSLGTGRLNFLPNNVPDIHKAMADFFDGDLEVEHLPVYRWLLGEKDVSSRSGFFINDLVVAKPGYDTTITLKVLVDGMDIISAVGDGVIISTPLGSTAYNLSAGGPVMDRGVRGFCVTPLNAHQTNLRPLIVPEGREIGVKVVEAYKGAVAVVDGSTSCQLPVSKVIRIWSSGEAVQHLINRDAMTFYERVIRKFGWLGS